MHEMEKDDQMFAVRIAPWHMDETNSIVLPGHPDPKTVLVHAGLDWDVLENSGYRKVDGHDDIYAPNGELKVPATGSGYQELPGWKVISRSDTGGILHVAKESYGVMQNEVGAAIMEALLGTDEAVKYETGGSIRGGQFCYLSAKVDEPFWVTGDDSPTFAYIVVTWAHDGSASSVGRATNVRVVCGNTISAAEAESERTGRFFSFRHTKNINEHIDAALEALKGTRKDIAEFQFLANELAEISISDATREEFVERFIPAPESTYVISDRQIDNVTKERGKVRGLFEGQTIPEAHRNTAYGLLLAGTEYLDHARAYRNNETYLNRTLLTEQPAKKKLVPMIRKLVTV